MTVQVPNTIPVSCDNPGDWPGIVAQIQEVGAPNDLTPEGVAQLVAVGVPILFAADASRRFDALHGLFSDHVITLCTRYAGYYGGAVPQSAVIHLVGVPEVGQAGGAQLRIHLQIPTAGPGPATAVAQQFWDIAHDQQLVVSKAACPSCGAPIDMGSVVCKFCGADVRSVSQVALSVTKVQIY